MTEAGFRSKTGKRVAVDGAREEGPTDLRGLLDMGWGRDD